MLIIRSNDGAHIIDFASIVVPNVSNGLSIIRNVWIGKSRHSGAASSGVVVTLTTFTIVSQDTAESSVGISVAKVILGVGRGTVTPGCCTIVEAPLVVPKFVAFQKRQNKSNIRKLLY